MQSYKRTFRKLIILLQVIILANSLPVYAKNVGTINDFRELTGEKRLDDKSFLQEIRQIIATYERGKEWDELVSLLKEIDGDIAYQQWQEQEKRWQDSIDKMDQDFLNNQSLEILRMDYSDYLTAVKERTEYLGEQSMALNFAKSTQEAYEYAMSILNGMGDDFMLGELGKEMKTFTQNNLTVQKPFDEEYHGILVSIPREAEIYSQLNGTVIRTSKTSVWIQSGKSIVMKYTGIKPVVKKGEKISQYQQIGNVLKEQIGFEVIQNTIPINPLFLYGSRGISWYVEWLALHPGGEKTIPDFSRVQDECSAQKENITAESTVKKEENESSSIKQEGDSFHLTNEVITKVREEEVTDHETIE